MGFELVKLLNGVAELAGIQSELTRQNSILEVISANARASALRDFAAVAHIVRNGDAAGTFDIGDQLITTYTGVDNTEYTMPWDIVHFGNVELEDGETIPGMCIQSHYATVEAVQFDNYEAFCSFENGLAPGTYNITFQAAYGPIGAGESLTFTTTQAIPAGGLIGGIHDATQSGTTVSGLRIYTYASQLSTTPIETLTPTIGTSGTNLGTVKTNEVNSGMNSAGRVAYGSNDYLNSAQRQWLNSEAAAEHWWEPKDGYQMAPSNLNTINGFLHGLPSDFKAAIKPVKIQVAANTVDMGGVTQVMYDKVFLPSLQQLYIVPQTSDVEGEYWEYWKRVTGATAPQARERTYPRRITYGLDNKQPQIVRLRSANRGYTTSAWYVLTSGYVYYSHARYAYRAAPACWIC